MRVGHLNVSRQPWYDRNPLVVGASGDIAGPTALVQLWRYTVPSRRLAYLDNAHLQITTEPAAAPGRVVNAHISVEDGGGVPITQVLAVLGENLDTRQFVDELISAFGVVTSGEAIVGLLESGVEPADGCLIYLSFKATEYDAPG